MVTRRDSTGPPEHDRTGLSVIGVGLHRTGSMSLKTALEDLGFGPCYHGMEGLRRLGDGARWLAAFDAEGEVDWPSIFQGFRSTLDWPTVHFCRQLITAYPEAKVILTDRDPEAWWSSHERMFRLGLAFNDQMTDDERAWAAESGFADMQTVLVKATAGFFGDRIFDREHCLKVFADHSRRVRETVPADRLLVYRVEDGWLPLCRFLDVDPPDVPFPRINAGDNLTRNIRTAMDQAQSGAQAEASWR